jgi:IMP cyclohydrolase
MTDIFKYLSERPYPGRGILTGRDPDGVFAAAYFIMGRSENSRNRIFARTPDGIRTTAFDPSKMTDPSLIIYHPVRRYNNLLIITNGDHTDTILEHLKEGNCYRHALKTRAFEPDSPNYTPRISAVDFGEGYALSILKALEGDDRCCCRYFYEYENAIPGTGHFISTYEGFGEPLPSFSGEPVSVNIPSLAAVELAGAIWDSLDKNNRVSVYAIAGGGDAIINKYGETK